MRPLSASAFISACMLVLLCWLSLEKTLLPITTPIPAVGSFYLRSTTRSLAQKERTIDDFIKPGYRPRILADDHVDDHAAVDDHSDDGQNGHGAGHPSLFHALQAIHVERGTFAMFIIIVFIILLKQLLETLHAITEDTPFYEMIGKIEEELMIVGTSSFLFKVLLNTTDFGDNDWAYPLEFAETLVPILAFSYCGVGIYVVLISLKQCYTWSRAHNLKAMELLDDYLEASKSLFFAVTWKPLLNSIEQMEFRIFHNIFCTTFQIQKGAFAFDEYISKVFQRYVLELIEIRILDWIYVAVILCINLGRVKLGLHFHSCELHDVACDDRRTIDLFTIVGAVIFSFAMVMLVASRRLELRVLALHGMSSHLHYAQYIQAEEEAESSKGHRMDASKLKSAASKAKEQGGRSKKNAALVAGLGMGGRARSIASGGSGKFGSGNFSHDSNTSLSAAAGREVQDAREEGASMLLSPAGSEKVKPEPSGGDSASRVFADRSAKVVPFSDTATATAVPTPGEAQLIQGSGLVFPEISGNVFGEDSASNEKKSEVGGSGNALCEEDSSEAEKTPPPAGSRRRAMGRQASVHIIEGFEEQVLGQQSEVIMNLFWFRQPTLYFEAVELLLLAVSFYIALWLTVMLTAAPTGYWKVLSILPGLLICGLFFHIVKTAALLRAISAVDTDVMLEVIEETEAAQQLSAELRTKVVGHLSSAGSDNYVELERLYKQIDLNNSNSLSRSEFSDFLSLLDISFSSKKWERIFKEIDRNYDNEISFQEFFLYLFPDHDLALSLELRRLKAISRRVATRANYFLLNLSPFGGTPAALERTASGKVQTAARASTASTAALPALNAIRSALSGQRPSQLAAQSDDTSISNRDFGTPDARAFTLARLARRSSSGQGQQQQQQPALVEEAGEE